MQFSSFFRLHVVNERSGRKDQRTQLGEQKCVYFLEEYTVGYGLLEKILLSGE